MVGGAFGIDDDQLRAWGSGLVSLVHRHLPKQVPGSQLDEWSLVGPSYVAKASGTLEAILDLLEDHRMVDATILLRGLFENVLVFSWIGINPEANLAQWIKRACRFALASHRDWGDAGRPLLDEADVAYCEAKKGDANITEAPDRKRMAEVVDAHWNGTYPGRSVVADGAQLVMTFQGLYRHVYRLGSDHAHQDPRGLRAFFTSDAFGETFVHTEHADEYAAYPWLLGDYVLTLGLAISSSVLGWPSAPDVWKHVPDAALTPID